MTRLEIKNYNMILTEKEHKYQHYITSQTEKYKYLTSKEILPPNQSWVIKQAKFTNSSLRKTLEKK